MTQAVPRHGRLSPLALGSLLTLAALSPADSTDWPQFRGPFANGLAADATPPSNLAPDQALAWKIALPGRGLSSPIIIGDRLVVTCSSGPRQDRLHVICFRVSDGAKLWERQFWATGRVMTHEKTCVAAPTPASDGRRIFALYSSNDLICLDLEGNLLWCRGLTRDYPNASNSLGMASSPVVIGETLIVQIENDGESFAAGLDVTTGQNRWKHERPKGANWTSPQILTDPASGQPVVALQSKAGVHAVEPATGRELWQYTDGASTIPSSAAHRGLLFVPSHGITALRPSTPPGSAPPQQLWRSSQLRPGTASPLVLDDKVFVLNDAGVLNCGDAKTGSRLWQLRLKGPFSASPIAAGRFLYVVNEKGLVQIVNPHASEGAVLGEFPLDETILGTPSIARDALYLRSDQHLWKFQPKTSG